MKTYRCGISITNKAKEKIRELGSDERSFFLLEKSFHVHIEKYPQEDGEPLSVALVLDNKRNAHLAEKFNGLIIVLHCIVEPNQFRVINVTTRPPHISFQSNWLTPANLSFSLNAQRTETLPIELLSIMDKMPVAQESSTYVKKRIRSWEGYLKIEERTADIPDMTSHFSRLIFNEDFSRVTISGLQLSDKEWKSLKDLSVKLRGVEQDVGKVLKANRSNGSVEVEVNGYLIERARKQQLNVHPKEVTFSNFAALSQVKRLRQGFKQLENGFAANPDLQRLLFEKKPPVKPIKKKANLQFHNRLNEFQKNAVTGAMSVEDLYVIQGPPGTGKTTVISEICLQNAKAGLRTLVASQSNLAVDNALGRLLAHKDIRILRVGRTESIEEEGKKFIEENVGQYWKDHTLREVSSQFEAGKERGTEIEAEWAKNEEEQEYFQTELERVEEELERKKRAEEQNHEIQQKMNQLLEEIKVTEDEKKKSEKQIELLKQSLLQLKEDETRLGSPLNNTVLLKDLQAAEQRIWQLQEQVAGLELQKRIEHLAVECENRGLAVKESESLLIKVKEAKKLDTLKWIILEQNLKRTRQIGQLIQELDDIRFAMEQFNKLKTYNEKLTAAISYLEEKKQLTISQKGMITNTNSEEIDQFLNRLRGDIRSTKPLHSYLEGLYARRNSIWQRTRRLRPFAEYASMAQAALHQLKEELLAQLHFLHGEKVKDYQDGLTDVEELRAEFAAKMSSIEVNPNAKELLTQQETVAQELKKKFEENKQIELRIEETKEKLVQQSRELEALELKHIELTSFLEELYRKLKEKEGEQASLQEILSTEPEKEQEDILKKLASISFTRESLKEEKERLPLFQSIQGQWLSLLENANEHDLNEIRKLYVKHANVIGTTCVASARKDFIESYPVFDVVIIDEVSKATPPELLLPMLKGKKIILVGDHHQLPPLLGNDTLEETLQEMADESDDFEGKAELKELLRESLFERLFKELPGSHKTMLAIQYRMHENIMKTITPFYKQESDELQCGLVDSDFERDHLLESEHIQRENHLLWLDMPNEPAFFEERMKGGKSLYNPAELQKIADFLKELDGAVMEAKKAGRMVEDDKKSIGVISFYGEQVKRIDRMIGQEMHLPNLMIRTGTVDKFQGMEMDVIVVSMVRNHGNPQDDIGFAKDYRRLNVALSRAKKLLVLIGSTKMFTARTKQKDAREMYQHVLKVVEEQQGLRRSEKVIVHG